MQFLQVVKPLFDFNQIRAKNNIYLLNISFKLLAGKNLTFWEALIWIDSPVLGFRPTLAFLLATL